MESSVQANVTLDRIDTEIFFGLLESKLDKHHLGLVAAAIAESICRVGVAHVLESSNEPRARIAKLRKKLSEKLRSASTEQ